MRFFKLSLVLSVFALFSSSSQATHIVGADLVYACIDSTNNQYWVELTLYRDCTPSALAGFDAEITLFFYNGTTHAREFMVDIPKTFTPTPINPPNVDACLNRSQINGFCAEYGTYRDTVTLPPLAGGYDIAWTRCCRNNAITNLVYQEGITLLAHVPTDHTPCNSSPRFNQLAPMFLCAGQPFVFDHSATDPDGDSLVYRVTDPFAGVNMLGIGSTQMAPRVTQLNPMGSPPYRHVTYVPPYSYLDPFGTGNFQVNAQSGLLTLVPNTPGLFVFAVSVFEYRNGILLSENKRDFQIHVLNCISQATPPTISSDLNNLPQNSNDSVFVKNDTIVVQPARPFCYPAILTDPNPADTVIMFPVSSYFGVGGNANPPYASLSQSGVNPAYGTICWTPGCELAGQWIDMVVGGYDPRDCPGYNVVFDTVRIQVAGATPPKLSHKLPLGGDTAWVKAGEQLCYDFTALDIDPFDGVIVTPLSGPFVGLGGTAIIQDTGVNPVKGTVCWTTDCDDVGETVVFRIGAVDTNFCNKSHPVTDEVVVIVIPNAPDLETEPVTACYGSSAQLFANVPANGKIFWSPGNMLDDSTSATPGLIAIHDQTFSIRYVDPFGCTHADSLSLVVSSLPQITAEPDSAKLCPGDSISLQVSTQDLRSVTWSPSYGLSSMHSPDVVARPLKGITYRAIVENAEGCKDTVYIPLTMLPVPNIDAGEDIKHCANDPVQLHGSGGVRYAWEPSTFFQNNQIADPFVVTDTSMTFTLTGWNEHGCKAEDFVQIETIEQPKTVIDFEYVPCDRESHVELYVSGGERVLWRNGSDLRSRTEPLLEPRHFYAQVFEDQCAGIPDSIEVFPYDPFPVADFTASPEAGIAPIDVQFLNLSSKATRYQWNFGKGYIERTDENPLQTFRAGDWDVRLIAFSAEGCADTAWMKLGFDRPSLFIPSAFSPNGDGVNEDFYVGSYGMTEFDFRVYTRWGNEIFYSDDPAFKWDGTYRGANVPEGVYVYKLVATSAAKRREIRTGTVTLIR
ncbi:MAG: gliding motility-associated C-terminal domain-containing protein [Bacteroidia bacterium]